MSTVTINDLPLERALERTAMARVRGAAGAGWVFGWIRPFVPEAAGLGPVVNFYQTNNIFIANQMNNQIAVIDIDNAAANASIHVDAKQLAINSQR